jgi:hypothetical protein
MSNYSLSSEDKAAVHVAMVDLMRTRGPLPPEALDEVAAIVAAYRDERRRERATHAAATRGARE